MFRRLLRMVLALSLLAALTAPISRAVNPAPVPSLQRLSADEVSPGVVWERWSSSDPALAVEVARIAPAAQWRLVPVLSNGLVAESVGSRLERTTAMCRRMHCVAAVNADQWVVDQNLITGTPVGGMIVDRQVLSTPRNFGYSHAYFSATGGLRLDPDPPTWELEITGPPNLRLIVDELNRDLESGGISLLTPKWGTSTLTPEGSREWLLRFKSAISPTESIFTVVEERVGPGPIGPNDVIVTTGPAREADAADFFQFITSKDVTVRVDPGDVTHVVGGTPILLEDGESMTAGKTGDPRAPRTIFAQAPNGDLMLITIDGRRAGHSIGSTLAESANIAGAVGAHTALNLDGGGSTTFVIGGAIKNRVSDAAEIERRVVSALVVGPPEGFDFGVAVARSLDAICPDDQVPPSGFSDVEATNVHLRPIDCLRWRAMTNGIGDGKYGPKQAVSREQMASFIVNLMRVAGHEPPPGDDAFADDDGSVHEGDINRLAAAGIVAGKAPGIYDPFAPVTRGQMATFAVRAYEAITEASVPSEADFFIDDSLDTHETSINRAAGLGIATGKSQDSYDPGSPVRRDQMASFILRTLAAV